MAKKDKPGRPKKPQKPMVIGFRGSAEWKAWIDELAIHSRLTTATMIDHALADWAKKVGFKPPPPR